MTLPEIIGAVLTIVSVGAVAAYVLAGIAGIIEQLRRDHR
jgi:hypothetical protein